MPRIPRPRTALLFATPVMVHAGTLALWPPDEPTLDGCVPRLIATCAAACAVAWVTASASEDRPAGPAAALAGLSLATLGAGAFTFAGCLAYLMTRAGQFDGILLFGVLTFALMALAGVAVLAYVLGSAFEVGPAVAVSAMALHVAALAPLMTHPSRPAAVIVTAAAALVCLWSFARSKRKPAP